MSSAGAWPVVTRTTGILRRWRCGFVSCFRQTGDAYAAVSFMPDVEPDQQGRDLLDDACILQFAAVNRADARDLCCEFHGDLGCRGIIAAHDHIAVHVLVPVQNIRGYIVKGPDDRYSLRYEFGSLLRRRALPDAKGASSSSADARGQRNRGINQNAAGTNRSLQLLQ